jgi:hypothetical protein
MHKDVHSFSPEFVDRVSLLAFCRVGVCRTGQVLWAMKRINRNTNAVANDHRLKKRRALCSP